MVGQGQGKGRLNVGMGQGRVSGRVRGVVGGRVGNTCCVSTIKVHAVDALCIGIGACFYIDDMLKLIDFMGMYKLNKFHLHLTDDEGWRLEIPGIPELTDVCIIYHYLDLF